MRKSLLIAFSIIVLIFEAKAQGSWVGFSSETPQIPSIGVQNVADGPDLILDIQIPGMYVGEAAMGGAVFQQIQLIQNITTQQVALPQLPQLHQIIGIPMNKKLRVTLLEKQSMTFENYWVYPFQEPEKDSKDQKSSFAMNLDFYNGNGSFPERNVVIDRAETWRDVVISGLHITPFTFYPSQRKLEAIYHLKIKIEFYGDDAENQVNSGKSVSPLFYRMYQSSIINFEDLGITEALSADTAHKYLVITHADALPVLQPFIDWKNEQGFRVKVRTLGPGFNTPQAFKDFITQLYNDEGLEYVLMVGDAYPDGGSAGGPNIVPMFYWAPSGEDPTYSDSWYTCLDGPDDHFADLAIGRFVYNNLEELQMQVNKTMAHYFEPDTSTNWAAHSLLVAHEENYPLKYTQCKEEIRAYTYPLGNPVFQPCYGGAGASNADIVNFVNNTSCGIFNYRGHGSSTEFWEWCSQGSFDSSHVNQLTNQNRYFVLFDVCCDNMDVVNFSGDCLCESFMKSPVAAVAINGAIIPSYTVPNHDYDKEMYKAVYEQGIYNIGYITNYANLTVLNVHGTLGRSNVRTYLWLGDASLEPWTNQAVSMSVTHDSQILLGMSTFPVIVTGPNGPVEGARVCISNSDGSIYAVGFSDAAGLTNIQFQGAVQIPGMVKVTATSHNFLPYQASIPVIPPSGPYVIKENFSISDNAGNSNSLLDYGESVTLSLSVKNVGVADVDDVNVTLTTEDPYVTMTDTTEFFGSIAAGGIGSVNDAYAFSIANNVPDHHSIMFKVKAADTGNAWISHFSIQAHAPLITYLGYTIADPAGNGNGKLDPGETANIIVVVKNTGSSDAMNVEAILSSNDALVTVNTLTQNYGNLSAGGSGQQLFSVTTDLQTPAGYPMDFDLGLTADLGISGTASFTAIVGQIPILILDLDPNTNSGPAMQTAIDDLGLSAEYLTAIPSDLSLYNSIFLCLGIYSSNYSLSGSEGQRFADYLNGGGRLYMEGGDTWAYDAPTAVHSLFQIAGLSDGYSDLSAVAGVNGTFTSGMNFIYSGENNYMDRIGPLSNAFTILTNPQVPYNTVVAYDGGTYRTIGSSHEFGGLQDDVSPSTKTELMEQYLIFFGLLQEGLHASFSGTPSTVCQYDSVSFTDLSSGNPASWYWLFPGGSPSASAMQNPIITYTQSGSYDVTLITTDGQEFDTLTKANYVQVINVPVQPNNPSGPAQVCNNSPATLLLIQNVPFADSYQWNLYPPNAGTISGTGSTASISWTPGFSGNAHVYVSAVNECGTGPVSAEFVIEVLPIPTIIMTPLPNVCLNWPVFPLSGASPAGGTYSGPGVVNNNFNPILAGTGSKTISYAFADTNGCLASANTSLFVDACTGTINISPSKAITLYPNPNHGSFTLEYPSETETMIRITFRNTLGEVVAHYAIVVHSGNNKVKLDSGELPKGVYFLHFASDQQEFIKKLVID